MIANETWSNRRRILRRCGHKANRVHCKDLVTARENKNPLQLTININPNGTVGVDNAEKATRVTPTTTITPVTLDPKAKSAKRPLNSEPSNKPNSICILSITLSHSRSL